MLCTKTPCCDQQANRKMSTRDRCGIGKMGMSTTTTGRFDPMGADFLVLQENCRRISQRCRGKNKDATPQYGIFLAQDPALHAGSAFFPLCIAFSSRPAEDVISEPRSSNSCHGWRMSGPRDSLPRGSHVFHEPFQCRATPHLPAPGKHARVAPDCRWHIAGARRRLVIR